MRTVLLLAASVIAAHAAAQADGRALPTDPQAPVPGVQYRSAFTDYRSFREPEAADWREVNEQMRALGGHMGHAGRGKPPARPQAGQDPQRAAPGGHAGHK